jgi:hypothetical protein
MLFFTPSNTDNTQTRSLLPDYYSVEFPLGEVQPLYQFKLWRSDQNSFFLLAKDSSDLVARLKVGRIVPMKYYSENAMQTAEVHNTQITEIVKETQGRFSGHYRIELNIVPDGYDKSQLSDNNEN